MANCQINPDEEMRPIFTFQVTTDLGVVHEYKDAVSFMIGGEEGMQTDRTLWIYGNGLDDPDRVRAVYNEDGWKQIYTTQVIRSVGNEGRDDSSLAPVRPE